MPTIRPSADLRNSYNEISQFCHEYSEPVFITKNGKGKKNMKKRLIYIYTKNMK